MCDCVKRINGILKERNTEMNIAFFFDGKPTRPIIEVSKIDKKVRGKAQAILAKFCPFCGTEYEPTSSEKLS